MQLYFLVLVFVIFIKNSNGSQVLMLTLGGTKSHKIPFYEIANTLSARGHNVTFVSGFTSENFKKIEEIVPKKVKSYIDEYSNRDMLGARMKGELPISLIDAFRFPLQVCNEFYQDEDIINLMKRSFDVAILDGAFPECGLGLVHKMKINFMYLNTVGLYTGSLSMAGNPIIYSITPAFASSLSDDMSIIQRGTNVLWHLLLQSVHFIMVRTLRVTMRKYIYDLPDLYHISSNVSFILQNGNPLLTYPRPLLPNVAEVACVHCRNPRKLPDDIEDFINRNNSNGFIYVSMGSSVKTSKMPAKLRRIMIEAFKALPYNILWKWEDSEKAIQYLPKNVKTSTWFPQQDILGHPKLKLFVTHGGLLSLFESVYHGAPIIVIPVFCDHDANAAKAVADGYAIKMELASLNTQKLIKSIQTIVEDSKYKEAAQKYQKLLLDIDETPADLSAYWIEYVIRHNGANHLKSIGRKYGFIEFYSIDILILILLGLLSYRRIRFSKIKFIVKTT